jgi:hypothetical protein
MYGNVQFTVIQTFGKLPDGRIIEQTISDPRGISYQEMQQRDEALVKAFGNTNSRSVGTPMKEDKPWSSTASYS